MTEIRVNFDENIHRKLTKLKDELEWTWKEVILRGLDGN